MDKITNIFKHRNQINEINKWNKINKINEINEHIDLKTWNTSIIIIRQTVWQIRVLLGIGWIKIISDTLFSFAFWIVVLSFPRN